MKKIFFSLIFSFAITTKADTSITTFDVNDVSFLWKVPLNEIELGKLIPIKDLISQVTLRQIVDYAKTVPPEFAEASSWKVAAVRIDPCGHDELVSENLSECKQEVRFVVQALRVVHPSETMIISDLSLHLIFELSKGAFSESSAFQSLVSKLVQLKKQNEAYGIYTKGIALGPHPAFTNPEFNANLKEVLLSTVHNSQLKKITFLGSENFSGPWLVFQGSYLENTFVVSPMKQFQNSETAEFTPQLANQGMAILPIPSNNNWPFAADKFMGPSIIELFPKEAVDIHAMVKLSDGSESKLLKISDIIHAFDNPAISHRGNTDCISCHTSTPRGYSFNLYDEPSGYRYRPSGTAVTMDANYIIKTSTNLRMFGWFGSRPSVTHRTVNESAQVALLLNEFLKAKK